MNPVTVSYHGWRFYPWNVKMASSQDAWYLSLLGLAENFRTSSPPNIKSCIQCLQAVFNFKPPPRVEARTHLQLGNILLTHTKNIDLARSHLEQAVSWIIICTLINCVQLFLLISCFIFIVHYVEISIHLFMLILTFLFILVQSVIHV